MSTVEEVRRICRSPKKSPLCQHLKGRPITENTNVSDKFYSPLKYFLGLNEKEIKQRLKEIEKGRKSDYKSPKSYKPFSTDIGKPTKKSRYTAAFEKLYPNAHSLEEKSRITGIPLSILQQVYNKGLAAWRTGHRPGATQGAWGTARVNSFIMHGKTVCKTDKSLLEEALKNRKVQNWYSKIDKMEKCE
jgi:hypothetical protein